MYYLLNPFLMNSIVNSLSFLGLDSSNLAFGDSFITITILIHLNAIKDLTVLLIIVQTKSCYSTFV
jgi:hypothetical protein